ncbi:MAG: hypothetical protein NVS2B9_02810 [Myxococcales bacterium]
MLLRRFVPLAAALGAVACTPGIPQESTPPVDVAVFDPAKSKIPLPNDLVFQALAAGQIPPGAQRDLLQIFRAAALKPDGTCANGRPACGAFPSDQEAAIAIDFQRLGTDPKTGAYGPFPAPLDLTKVTPCDGSNGAICNVAVIELAGAAPTLAKIDPPVAADYVVAGDHGTLTLHRKLPAVANSEGVFSRRWTAGAQYIVAVRGGPKGLPTAGGSVQPSPTFYLLTRGIPLDQPVNQTLLPGTPAEKLAAGKQLEALRQSYLGAFGVVEKMAFPRDQLAVLSTFQIAAAPSGVRVQTDASAGAIPLPSDFLLDATTGKVQNLPGAFGALAPGIATLDGFSTTAMVLAQLSGPVKASSINGKTVFLYKFVTDSAGKITKVVRLVDVAEALGLGKPNLAGYISEPPQLTQAGAAQVIGLQPAQPILGFGTPFAVPPLDESTEYGVVVTDGVLDLASAGLARSTLSQILLFANPLADAAGRSLLGGVPDAQAAGLEQMRQALVPMLAQWQADTGNPDRTHVAMAYTFRTQSVTGKSNIGKTGPGVDVGALGLAAAPYKPASLGLPATYFTPGAIAKLTPAIAFTKYGIEPGPAPTTVPSSNIQEVLEVSIPTANLLNPATGAFGSAPAPETLPALVSVPKAANVTAACPAAYGLPPGTKCAPLVIFHHGLGGTKAQMLTVADSLNAKGLVVAAIDSPKHGDRAFCSKDSECEAAAAAPGTPATANACIPIAAFAGQGDATVPGSCTGPGSNGNLLHVPQLCASNSCNMAWGTYAATSNGGKSSGQTVASANYLVTANFFRTRDTIRQDVLDNSALIVALSPPAAGPPSSVQTELIVQGLFIDPTNIQWLGQSYGSILGAINVAANPRLGKAVLNVGGGTVVDIFSTPGSSFYPTLVNLLASLKPPIAPGTPTYLQFLNVGKWVLDPADPINFATHVTANTLPNLLNTATPGAPQTAKAVLGQIAHCDATVPNQTNANLYLNMGLGPLYTGAAFGASAPGTLTKFFDSAAAQTGTACVGVGGSDANATPHGFITSWGISYNGTTPVYDGVVNQLTQAAQASAADFLSSGTATSGNPQPNVVTK